MRVYRKIEILIIGLLVIHSCSLDKSKNSNISNDQKINPTANILTNKIIFIDYDSVILDLKYKVYKGINYKYNLVYILLLDSAEKELIKSQSPDYIEEFKKYPPTNKLNETIVGFYTEKDDIREIFKSSNDQRRIIECVHPENNPGSIEPLVYVKDNKVVFEISGSSWSDTYFARLKNNIIQINLLGGYIE